MTLLAVADSTLEVEVGNTLANFVSENEMFTAFDVTRAVRAKLSNSYINHTSVRDICHALYEKEEPPFENGVDYIREDFSFMRNGSTISCQLFRPVGADSTKYDPDRPIDIGRGAFIVPSKAGNISSAASAQSDNDAVSLKTDKRGRVTITAALLRAIGLDANGWAFISIINHSTGANLAITKPHFSDSPLVKIDKDCNIRLSRTFLKRKGFDSLTLANVKKSTILCK